MNQGELILHDIGNDQILLAEIANVLSTPSTYRVIVRYANEPFYTKYVETRKTKEFILMINPNSPPAIVINPDKVGETVSKLGLKKVEELT